MTRRVPPATVTIEKSDSPTQPTHTRWRIIFLLFAISVVTYIDRVNISVAARQMMPALGLTDLQMGQVFSAFVLGYALCQIPGGWLGDRWGPTRVLTVAIVWWSFFTGLTAMAATLPFTSVTGVLGSADAGPLSRRHWGSGRAPQFFPYRGQLARPA